MEGPRFAPMLNLPDHPAKPRRSRRTMIFDRGWPAVFIEGVLESFADAIDIAKISAWHMHQPESIVKRKIEMYQRFGIEAQCGGPVLELARLQGREDGVLDYLKGLGFDGVEVSSESLPTQVDFELERSLADKCLAMGFTIHGEVGKKFPEGDQVRKDPGVLDLDAAIANFQHYIDIGCDGSYFEGHLLRAMCGDMGENESARAQLVDLVDVVGLDNIIFEIPGTFLDYAGKAGRSRVCWCTFSGPMSIWETCSIEEVAEAEEIRDGTFPTFGAPNGDHHHPWLASLSRTGTGVAEPQWWRGPQASPSAQ